MRIAIIGGKLQGCEAIYLSKLAGYESVLIDKNPQALGSLFCDTFVCGDIVKEDENVVEAMKSCDIILPANENIEMLKAIRKVSEREGLKLAFDYDAYEISSSKIRSDKFFREHGIPVPRYYPEGKAPYIIKPSGESGSQGVRVAKTNEEVENFFSTIEDPENWIVEEYLNGPSYSIEVIGNGETYRTYEITQIHMDSVYDCCKVTAPVMIDEKKKKRFEEIGQMIGSALKLKGLTDVEVIDDGDDLKVLEIDARIPSQTPIAVYYSSGNNLLTELCDIILYGSFMSKKKDEKCFSTYEHYRLENGEIIQEGEHSMTIARPLRYEEGLFGSKTAVTDFVPGCKEFRGIFVNWDKDEESLNERRRAVFEKLKEYACLDI